MIDLSVEGEEIDEDILRIFVWSVWNFFGKVTKVEPEVGMPYLFDKFPHDDYTGIIAVNGLHKGSIFLSVPEGFLNHMLENFHASALSNDPGLAEMEELRVDTAGEILNIVAGNARNYLGEDFLISVPVVTQQSGVAVAIPESTLGIVFPVSWGGYAMHLVLAFQEGKTWNVDQTLEQSAV